MKVIIPLAGKGTRLRPLTHTVPKPLLEVAGKAVLDYVVEDLVDQLDVEELIFITGHLKEQVEAHVRAAYSVPSTFVEQAVQNGTAGAIKLAQPHVDGPLLIVFVDTLFDADLSAIRRDPEADGFIWAKEVEDYRRFGVIVTDEQGVMQTIVEKPSEPISRLANIGLYYLRDHELLFEGIDHTLESDPYLGEYFLTDAFQYMVDHGSRIQVLEVQGWYDCGKPETLLATNRHLLETGGARRPESVGDVKIEEPVRVEEDVEISSSVLGPNVSVGKGSRILRSMLRDCIVGEDVVIEDCTLSESLIGSNCRVRGIEGTALLGADSVVGCGGEPPAID
ncbi:MAG: NTP transferase domain-containing protein [Gemmatimonadetes bacterium]|uniref:NTP transferase domain-containing protein n=1 Tax=Candidatus Kutchimonas denitrificans TaxID=3056748 RepID=A0AAE4ZBV9_9BACT|nr:NTP transferase domain-containing protein [Gemmatimonadota bacterium]NIR75491.1 NTP transferase domain-containing protein [Candidatus Kutchimonas denitrificans]NIS01805.1 NTP transferase domain-containing protein [Gemmatimonadota bacterium]NIT67586.1 NTP transferase domain-containing protein [Gemmatimonadota bacterium]NIU53460.1 NTP transferase domain-containing protein [Gemmatimonadota bacterium]